ncbi:MAG: DUF2332 family protein [Candidatus Pacebacteria bacterium]|nr:DUF2332 family protein [Candidatus Paceibacterota bacterium]
MHTILAEELDFVGLKKKLPWLNRTCGQDPWFVELIEVVRTLNPSLSIRNILYALIPHSEHVASVKTDDTFASYECWKSFMCKNEERMVRRLARHGTQGNLPQRAAILLDYLHHMHPVPIRSVCLVEFGCSAGLLGRVCLNARELFDPPTAERFFWLARLPRIGQVHVCSYVGVDRVIPSEDMVPYFIRDLEKREKIRRFMNEYSCAGDLREQTIEEYLAHERETRDSVSTVYITSFMLYQFSNPAPIALRLQARCEGRDDRHWLDLSRAEVLAGAFDDSAYTLDPTHIYLRHNGVPVAHVIGGSDDCPNWEYI